MSYTLGSLFSGIGGIDLGFERAGFTTAWQVEIEPYCRKVLERHFPHAHRFNDIRECGAHNLSRVDVVAGGFPCQPASIAGRRRGKEDERWLWPECFRIIRELRPRFTFLENVSGLLSLGMAEVLADLSSIGYDGQWEVIPARSVGADHERDRVWIVAYPYQARYAWRVQTGTDPKDEIEFIPRFGSSIHDAPNVPRKYWSYKPIVGRGIHGVPNRVDRIASLGNAVVPQIPEMFAREIRKALERAA